MSSDEIEEENSEQLGLRGYQWEPEYTEEELVGRHSNPDDNNVGHSRSASLALCKCTFCTSMPTLCESM